MRFKSRAVSLSAMVVGAMMVAACGSSETAAPAPKNVIFFLGDGMGITTLTAARIYSVGEDGELTIDTLPETGFIKTHSNDAQVTDSAPSMSAYMTGVKPNNDVIAMSADTRSFTLVNGVPSGYVSSGLSTCPQGNGSRVPTLIELAKAAGLGTGVVTTARLTHATPAATYSHICHRDGEYDIAAQAVPGGAGFNTALGDGVDVMLGGISYYWTPYGTTPNKGRIDNRNLINEMKAAGYTFVSDRAGLTSAPLNTKLFGLFDQALAQGHMSYELDRNPAVEPSLAEMTAKAIDLLQYKTKGYMLVVEGGRIDHALHATNAARAMADTVAFDQAIAAAIARVDLSKTLIVVTADHDHTLVMNGYAQRTGKTVSGTNAGILGVLKNFTDGSVAKDAENEAYPILGFGNGESRPSVRAGLSLTDTITSGKDYHQEAVVPTSAGGETHGGGDVFIGAIGRGAAAIAGVMDNTAVFGILKAALGL